MCGLGTPVYGRLWGIHSVHGPGLQLFGTEAGTYRIGGWGVLYLSEIGMKRAFYCNWSSGLSHRCVEFPVATWSGPLVAS